MRMEADTDRIKALPSTLTSAELENNVPLVEAVTEIWTNARRNRSIVQ